MQCVREIDWEIDPATHCNTLQHVATHTAFGLYSRMQFAVHAEKTGFYDDDEDAYEMLKHL